MRHSIPTASIKNRIPTLDSALGQIDLIDRSGEVVRSWRISHPKCTLGSSPECSVVLGESGVSPIHATLIFGKRHTLLRAVAPVRIGSRLIREWLIDSPTEIQIAEMRLVIHPTIGVIATVVHAEKLVEQAARLCRQLPIENTGTTASGQDSLISQLQKASQPQDCFAIQSTGLSDLVIQTEWETAVTDSDAITPITALPIFQPTDVLAPNIDARLLEPAPAEPTNTVVEPPKKSQELEAIERLLLTLQASLERVQESLSLETKQSSQSITASVVQEFDTFGKTWFSKLQEQLQDQSASQGTQLNDLQQQLNQRFDSLDGQLAVAAASDAQQATAFHEMLELARVEKANIEAQLLRVIEHREELSQALQILRREIADSFQAAQEQRQAISDSGSGSYALNIGAIQANQPVVPDTYLAESLERAQLQIQQYNEQVRALAYERDAALARISQLTSTIIPDGLDSAPNYGHSANEYGTPASADSFVAPSLNQQAAYDIAPIQDSLDSASFQARAAIDDLNEASYGSSVNVPAASYQSNQDQSSKYASGDRQAGTHTSNTDESLQYASPYTSPGDDVSPNNNQSPISSDSVGSYAANAWNAPVYPEADASVDASSTNAYAGDGYNVERPSFIADSLQSAQHGFAETVDPRDATFEFRNEAEQIDRLASTPPETFNGVQRDAYIQPYSSWEQGVEAYADPSEHSADAESSTYQSESLPYSNSDDVGVESVASNETYPEELSAYIAPRRAVPSQDDSIVSYPAPDEPNERDSESLDPYSREQINRSQNDTSAEEPLTDGPVKLPAWFIADEPPASDRISDSGRSENSPRGSESLRSGASPISNDGMFQRPDLSQYSDDLAPETTTSEDERLETDSETISQRLQRMLEDADHRRGGGMNAPSEPISSRRWSQAYSNAKTKTTPLTEPANSDVATTSSLNSDEVTHDIPDVVLPTQQAQAGHEEDDRELEPSPESSSYSLDADNRSSYGSGDTLGTESQRGNTYDEPADSHVKKTADQDPDSSEEESIEEYMQRLLQRVRTGPDSGAHVAIEPASPRPTRAASTAKAIASTSDTAISNSLSDPPSEPSKRPRPLTSELFAPRQQAPEQRNELDALRELANTNARRAINRSDSRRTNSAFMFKLAITGTAVFSATSLFMLNGIQLNMPFAGMISAIVVALLWGYDCLNHFTQPKPSATLPSAKTPVEPKSPEVEVPPSEPSEERWRPSPA